MVELRVTTATVEILHAGRRVASHARSFGPKGTTVTDPSHWNHRPIAASPPSTRRPVTARRTVLMVTCREDS